MEGYFNKRIIFLAFSMLGMCFMAHTQQLGKMSLPLCGLAPDGENYHALAQGPNTFAGKFFRQSEEIPLGKPHDWYLYLEDRDGNPLQFAKVAASGANYDAGRGFATPPTVYGLLSEGHYRVKNVKFSVPGTWMMSFQVIKSEVAEVLVFEIEVPDE